MIALYFFVTVCGPRSAQNKLNGAVPTTGYVIIKVYVYI